MRGLYWFSSCILILSVVILILVIIIVTTKDRFTGPQPGADELIPIDNDSELDIPQETWGLPSAENDTVMSLPPAEIPPCEPRYMAGDVPFFYAYNRADRNIPRQSLFEV